MSRPGFGIIDGMRPTALIAALLIAAPSLAQVRVFPDEVLSDAPLLDDIVAAFLEEADVDDPQALAARFPERTFADFDRNRSGGFLVVGDGFGINDVDLAILQFIHDIADADGDGVTGFVELECVHAGGPVLDPDAAETLAGVPDGDLDCDGDGVANRAEAEGGSDPLDPASMPDLRAQLRMGRMVWVAGDGEDLTRQPPMVSARFRVRGWMAP